MKRKVQLISSFFVCLILFLGISFSCQASEFSGKTVRVAYFDLGSYYQMQENGNMESYDKAYLDMISKYTGISFEYVDCKTWNQALEMLENHEIDLVGTMQWTQEREDKYEICDASYGFTVAELAATAGSDFIYEDYERMNGVTVGYMEGYVIGNKLLAYMDEKDISFNLQTFQTQQSLDNALENGEIDLIACNAHAVHDDWKVVEKFAYAPFYFASWKGNEKLAEEISQTIIKINLHQSDFNDELMKEYFPVMVNSPYNKEELDCIARQETYTIYLDEETKPIIWYDEESQSMQGVLADICSQLEKTTGLQFDLKPVSDKVSKDDSKTVTYRTLDYDVNNYEEETGVTDAILDQPLEMYHKVRKSYDTGGAYTIAIARSRDGILEYLQNHYPNCTIVEYESPRECMKALMVDDVELTFLNIHTAENVMITDSINEVIAIPMTDVIFGIALQFHGPDAELLEQIVNKGIKLLDTGKIDESMLQYAMDTAPAVTLRYIVNQHLGLFIAGCLVIILVIVICVWLLIYAEIMKRERNRMQAINQERSDFFARMSHDMRTPMNGILGMLELTDQTSDLEEIRNNTRKAKLSGNYMLSLINDILDLQRLESQKLVLEPQIVYVKDFIDGITEMIRPSAEQKHIKFIIENHNIKTDAYVKIDQVRAKQIFVNILSNAVKFTPEEGLIETTIECYGVKDKQAQVRVMIRDTGIGMSQEFISKNLFKPYSQERNRVTNRYAGSGLGLAIVKNLVELMGGSIQVQSSLGEGSCFTVCLDFLMVEGEAAMEHLQQKTTNPEEFKERLEGKHIMLCEDHPLNAEIAERILEFVGCKITHAQNGKEGLDIFRESQPYSIDLILMDIRMPVMDGLEAATAIRNLDREDAKTIPIVAMTANAYESDWQSSRQAGMNAHLAKPIDVELLYQTMVDLIGGSLTK